METRDEILKELQQIAPKLSALPRVNFYPVPQGYFEGFTASMLQNISTQNASQENLLLNVILTKTETPAEDVPAGYFNTFAANMLQKVQQQELAAVAPTLAGLPKVNLYTVPAGYFNALPKQLVKQVTANSLPEPIQPLWLQKLNSVLDVVAAIIFKPRYAPVFASLASVLIIVGITFYKPVPLCGDAMCQLEQGLSGISDEEIISYISENSQDFDAAMISEQTDVSVLNTMDVNDDEFDKQLDEFMQNEMDDAELNKAIQGS